MYDEFTKPTEENRIADYDTIVDRLAELYLTNYKAVADVCDFALDRSGILLGIVRRKALELRLNKKEVHP